MPDDPQIAQIDLTSYFDRKKAGDDLSFLGQFQNFQQILIDQSWQDIDSFIGLSQEDQITSLNQKVSELSRAYRLNRRHIFFGMYDITLFEGTSEKIDVKNEEHFRLRLYDNASKLKQAQLAIFDIEKERLRQHLSIPEKEQVSDEVVNYIFALLNQGVIGLSTSIPAPFVSGLKENLQALYGAEKYYFSELSPLREFIVARKQDGTISLTLLNGYAITDELYIANTKTTDEMSQDGVKAAVTITTEYSINDKTLETTLVSSVARVYDQRVIDVLGDAIEAEDLALSLSNSDDDGISPSLSDDTTSPSSSAPSSQSSTPDDSDDERSDRSTASARSVTTYHMRKFTEDELQQREQQLAATAQPSSGVIQVAPQPSPIRAFFARHSILTFALVGLAIGAIVGIALATSGIGLPFALAPIIIHAGPAVVATVATSFYAGIGLASGLLVGISTHLGLRDYRNAQPLDNAQTVTEHAKEAMAHGDDSSADAVRRSPSPATSVDASDDISLDTVSDDSRSCPSVAQTRQRAHSVDDLWLDKQLKKERKSSDIKKEWGKFTDDMRDTSKKLH